MAIKICMLINLAMCGILLCFCVWAMTKKNYYFILIKKKITRINTKMMLYVFKLVIVALVKFHEIGLLCNKSAGIPRKSFFHIFRMLNSHEILVIFTVSFLILNRF